jgi:hypothetical protein
MPVLMSPTTLIVKECVNRLDALLANEDVMICSLAGEEIQEISDKLNRLYLWLREGKV